MNMLMVAADAANTVAGLPIMDLLLGAVIMPPTIALLNQSRWPAPVKGLAALAACLVAALITEVLRGPVDFGDWRKTALVVAGSAFAAYRLWWQPAGIAPWLERATTVSGGRQVVDSDQPPPPTIRTDTHRPTIT